MKNILFILLTIQLTFTSCTKYEYIDDPYYLYGGIEVYIDNSNINEFTLEMIYSGGYIDTIIGKKWSEIKKTHVDNPRILKFDKLSFNINKNGVDKFLKVKYPQDEESKKFISVYPGKEIEIIIKDKDQILESYLVEIKDPKHSSSRDIFGRNKYNYQYILNPLSLSTYVIDTVKYGGLSLFEVNSKKTVIHNENFFSVNKIDWWFTPHPDSLSYTYIEKHGFGLDKLKYEIKGVNTISISKTN